MCVVSPPPQVRDAITAGGDPGAIVHELASSAPDLAQLIRAEPLLFEEVCVSDKSCWKRPSVEAKRTAAQPVLVERC